MWHVAEVPHIQEVIKHAVVPVPHIQEVVRHVPRVEIVEKVVEVLRPHIRTIERVKTVTRAQEVFSSVQVPVPFVQVVMSVQGIDSGASCGRWLLTTVGPRPKSDRHGSAPSKDYNGILGLISFNPLN